MNVDSSYFLAAMLKISLLIGAGLLLFMALGKAEPRWRVLVLRAILLALPVAALAGAVAPALHLPNFMGESGGGAPAAVVGEALPMVVIAVGETLPIDAGLSVSAMGAGVVARDAGKGFPWWRAMLAVWLSGVVVLLVRECLLKRRVVEELDLAVSGDESLNEEWQNVCAEFGVGSVPLLKVGSTKASPFLVGGKIPQLLIPLSLVEKGSVSLRRHVFRHEAAHLAAGDLRWFAAVRLLTRVFWFQPLLWLLEVKHLQACEEAADAEAARRGGTMEYRGALASLALELVPTGRAIPATAFFRGPSVLRRLRVVEHHGELKPPSRWRALLAMAAIVLGGAALGNVGLGEDRNHSTVASVDQQMAELSYEGYLESRGKGDQQRAEEYLKMAIEYLPEKESLKWRRAKWREELERLNDWFELQNLLGPMPDAGDRAEKPQDLVNKALREIILRSIDFRDVPLKDAIDSLYQQAEELNGDEKLPFRFVLDVAEESEVTITLKLGIVPLVDALRYVTSLAQVTYLVEGDRIRIVPLESPDIHELYTNVYPVSGSGKFPDINVSAKQVLENAGIDFSGSAAAVLNLEKGELVVRNTQAQLKLVEAWIADTGKQAIDPSDIWLRAYTLMKEAEALASQGKLAEALVEYEASLARFDQVHTDYSKFYPDIVRYRRKELRDTIDEMRLEIGRRGRLPLSTPPQFIPDHPVALPEKSESDGEELAPLVPLPVVPVEPSPLRNSMRDQLADPAIHFHCAKFSLATAQDGGQIRALTFEVIPASGGAGKIDAAKIRLAVRIYDRVGGEKLEIGVGETRLVFPSAPYDWSGVMLSERIEVEYRLPKAAMVADDREYFGFVAELYYDDVLQSVTASPSKLLRLVK